MDYELKPGFMVCYRRRARWIPAWLARLAWRLRTYDVDVVNAGYTVSMQPLPATQTVIVSYELDFNHWQ